MRGWQRLRSSGIRAWNSLTRCSAACWKGVPAFRQGEHRAPRGSQSGPEPCTGRGRAALGASGGVDRGLRARGGGVLRHSAAGGCVRSRNLHAAGPSGQKRNGSTHLGPWDTCRPPALRVAIKPLRACPGLWQWAGNYLEQVSEKILVTRFLL